MGGRREHCRDSDLAGIPQPDAVPRMKADRQIMPRGRRQPNDHAKAGSRPSSLDLTDQALADSSSLRNLALGQAGDGTSGDQFASEPSDGLARGRTESDARRWHDADRDRHP